MPNPILSPLRRGRALLVLVACLAAPAFAAPPAGFEQRVEQLRSRFGVPGVSVAIVENGRPTLARGWGVREIGTSRPVDADTIFATGSTGKAFTAAALAVLVDQGKIKWDDKVIDHMPYFRMYDPWVTREMTIRDLLVHRSGLGLGAGDLLFVPNSDRSRKEITLALRHIKPATSFRSAYAYDNILYIVAGQLIEDVSGMPWEQFMRRHVFQPLGMNNSTVSEGELTTSRNRAEPHARIDGPVRGLGTQVKLGPEANLAPAGAPAGGLAISANDMTRWLMAQLGGGKIAGTDRNVFSAANVEEMWSPVTIEPGDKFPAEFKAAEPNFQAYALGWTVQDYRGAKLVWHRGAVFGSLAAVALLPDRKVGLYVAVNSEEGEMIRGLVYELLDHYLDQPRANWPERFRKLRLARAEEAAKLLAAPAARPAKVGPSFALARYAGDYADPWYGRISIRESGGRLLIDFPRSRGMNGTLDHWQYDTFKTTFVDKQIEPALVTFGVGAEGQVERITMKAVSPIADFSYDYQDLHFARVAAKP
jgi:CubicO group peptidase (beta-lactamase class C family)